VIPEGHGRRRAHALAKRRQDSYIRAYLRKSRP
jgi:hypothetical protein